MFRELVENRAWNLGLRLGTTTIGVVCSDGVILVTDRRVTSGFFIANKRGKKICKIDDHIAATIAGVVADAQMLIDRISAQARLYKLMNGRPIGVKAAATLASNILFSARYYPFILQAIVAGVDDEGSRMFNLDLFGTMTEERYIATGSGSPMALGVLEGAYHDGMTVAEAIPVVIKAVSSSMKWDPASGEGFDVAIITKKGIEEKPGETLIKELGSL
ncbi:MAG: proteasome endopeptidase complex, archaeal, beta subunit [Thermoprotei archaeon]|nr:MAG: proteasome endopeptidase complex, archaeal, beta subunit [Thermoprotei archaeon]RLF18583.1 MAG: proteasome endopeptidase complex, archaeal, beta subunit [Thermoprotei archaeon]